MAPLLVRKNWEKFRLTSVPKKRLLHVFGVRRTVATEEPKQISFVLGPAGRPDTLFLQTHGEYPPRVIGMLFKVPPATDFRVVFSGLHFFLLGDLRHGTQILEASPAMPTAFPQANVLFGGPVNANGPVTQGGEGAVDVFNCPHGRVRIGTAQRFVAQHLSNTFTCGNTMSSAGDASTTWVPRRRCTKGHRGDQKKYTDICGVTMWRDFGTQPD